MSLLSRLFGGRTSAPKSTQSTRAEQYEGFAITPQPAREASGYRIAARIEKEVGGELKTHMMIRADTYADETTANEASLTKARQVIDEQGEHIFR